MLGMKLGHSNSEMAGHTQSSLIRDDEQNNCFMQLNFSLASHINSKAFHTVDRDPTSPHQVTNRYNIINSQFVKWQYVAVLVSLTHLRFLDGTLSLQVIIATSHLPRPEAVLSALTR